MPAMMATANTPAATSGIRLRRVGCDAAEVLTFELDAVTDGTDADDRLTRSPEFMSSRRPRRSFRRSFAVWYRSSGSFARQRLTIRPKSGGRSRFTSEIGRGVSR